MTGLLPFLRFEVMRLLRNPRYVVITVGFPVVFYALFHHSLEPSARIAGSSWNAYFMVSMASFGSMVAALNAGGPRLASERSSGWLRQLRVTPLPMSSYLLTKTVASMIIALPVICVVELTGVLIGGVRLSAGVWIVLTLAMWACSLPFVALGMVVGFFASSETAYPVVTALMFLLSFFGGLFTPVQHLPLALRDVANFLPSYHVASVGWSVVAARTPGLVDAGILLAYVTVLGLALVWRNRQEDRRAFS